MVFFHGNLLPAQNSYCDLLKIQSGSWFLNFKTIYNAPSDFNLIVVNPVTCSPVPISAQQLRSEATGMQVAISYCLVQQSQL